MNINLQLDWEQSVQLLNVLASRISRLTEGSMQHQMVESLIVAVIDARDTAARQEQEKRA